MSVALVVVSLAAMTHPPVAHAADGYQLQVSSSPFRTSPSALEGSTQRGDVYVFVLPEVGVKRVRYFIDDPQMLSAPVRIERGAPWDLAGTKTDGTALPFDTTALVDGSHVVTAAIDLSAGGAVVLHGSFSVQNDAPQLTFGPSSLALTSVDDVTPVTGSVALNASDGTANEVSLSSDTTWLVVPPSASTPGSIDVTADPSGLGPGTHAATVTATDGDGSHLAATLDVVLTVPVSDDGSYTLQVSASSDRAAPVALDGTRQAGVIFAFVAPESGVARVRFWMDDPEMLGTPSIEGSAPWDLRGTNSDGTAKPFDTTSVPDGGHVVTASIELSGGTVTVVHGSFTVDNTAPQLRFEPASLALTAVDDVTPVTSSAVISADDDTANAFKVATSATWLELSAGAGTTPATLGVTADPSALAAGAHTATITATDDDGTHLRAVMTVTLTVATDATSVEIVTSDAPDRSSPGALDGAAVDGDIYVHTAPATGFRRVRFFMDDPVASGTPYSIELSAPYDLAGTRSDGTAKPFDTTALVDGSHTVTAIVDLASGGATSVTATFEVRNHRPKFVFDPTTLDLQADENGAAVSAVVTVGASDSGAEGFQLMSSDTWLTADTASGITPASLTVTADPTGLAPGVHTARLTATTTASNGEPLDATLDVTFTVGNPDCLPVPCEEIRVDLPWLLDFSQDHGGVLDGAGTGTGFTYVDPPSAGAGYVPANLTVDLAAGALEVLTTNGLAAGASNSQDNALGVGVTPDKVLTISTTLGSLPAGTADFEQAGLWFGIDEDNYVKLVVQSVTGGLRVEHLLEIGGATASRARTSATALSGRDVTLTFVADPLSQQISASYSVDGGGAMGLGTFTLPSAFFSSDAAGIDPRIGTRTFTGILASHRTSDAPLTYRFLDFSVEAGATTGSSAATGSWFRRESHTVRFPTSMVWGPDGRLYVAELFGTIHALTYDAQKRVIADEVITTLGTRMLLGITVDPDSTASDVVLWTSHSSPSTNNGEVNSGTVSRLSGPGLSVREDIITGLPRAKANHGPNSLHFGPDGRLYLAIGGNTGAGAPNAASTEFGDRPEQPLSAALLVADVKAAGFEGACATPLQQFGVPGTCDVTTWATGLRNMYDFVFHSNGQVYGPDNGLGVEGTYPPRPTPDCTGLADVAIHNPGEQGDPLQRLEQGMYYGHPNPYRDECVFFDGSHQSVPPLPNFRPAMHPLGNKRSANGTIEYLGGNLCGSLRHELLVASYSKGDDITRLRLSSDGTAVVAASSLIGGFSDPLPLAQSPDGTIFVGEFGGNRVTALVPLDVGCWESKAPLPVELLDAGGAALGGRLYVVAGKTAAGPGNTVRTYDPATDGWSVVADLPGPAVENPAVVAHGGKLWVFGGSSAPFSGAVDNAAVYDPGTGSWTELPPMPTARGGASAQVVGAEIYVVGGMGADGASVSAVEVFDPLTSTWRTGTPMSTPRDNAGAASLDGKLYVFGGRSRSADGSGPTLDTVEAFDPGTGTWSTRRSMPTSRRTMVVGVLAGRAVVMGGEIASDGSAYHQNEEYDPVSDTWRTLFPMPTGRHGAAAGVVDGVMYVVGGGPTGGRSFSSVNEGFRYPAGDGTTAP